MQPGKDPFCFDIEEQTTFWGNNAPKTLHETNHSRIPTTYLPAFSDKNISYELKDVKIELPKVTISDAVSLKYDADGHTVVHLHKRQTARKSLKAGNINKNHSAGGYNIQLKLEVEEEGINTTAKILNFSCTKCKDTTKYSPNDLQKHFQLLHHGELPSYPCEMCKFSANDFQSFKQHRRTHRSTLVKCEICNDEHLYTLLDLTKHFTSTHCVNGHFRCEKCKFSTRDVGTFVQHIHRHNEIQYKCGKCNHVSFTKGESQRHLVVHTGTYPFSCHYCRYSATRKDYILKHVLALHKDQLYVKDKLDKDSCEKRLVKTTSGLKLVLSRYKTGGSKKIIWRQKSSDTIANAVVEKNGHALRNMDSDDEQKSGEQNQFVEACQVKEEKDQTSNNLCLRSMERENLSATIIKDSKRDGSSYGSSLLKDAIHGPTVLMVKNNKISVPANYCAKFMGFKVVNGRQHIAIKLLPTNKQNVHASDLQPEVVDCSTDFHSKATSRTNALFSTSPTAHATKLHTQQYKPSYSSSVSVSDAHSSENVKTDKQNMNVSPCALSFSGTVKENTSSTAVQLCLTKKMGTRNSSVTPGSASLKKTRENADNPKYLLGDSLHNRGLASTHNYFVTFDDCNLTNNNTNEEHVSSESFSHQSSINSGSASSGASSVKDKNLQDSWSLPSKISTSNGDVHIEEDNFISAPESDAEKQSFNQGLESIHNYFVMTENWNPTNGKTNEEFIPNQSFILQSTINSGPASSGSPLMKDSNLDFPLPTKICAIDGRVNTVDSSLASVCENSTEKLSFVAKQDSVVHHVSKIFNEKSNQLDYIVDNASLNTMPKITSVFSLQKAQTSGLLLQDVNCLSQNRLKRKLNVAQNISTPEAKMVKQPTQRVPSVDGIVSCAKYPATTGNLSSLLSSTTKGNMSISCSTSSNKYCEKQIPVTLCSSENTDKLSQSTSFGSLCKPQSDALTQQLVNEKICINSKNSWDISSLKTTQIKPLTMSEGSKAVLVHPSAKRVLVPLHLANKPALQVVKSEILPSNTSDANTVKGNPVSGLLGPGMVLTFSSGTFGAITNVSGNHSQVSSTVNCNVGKRLTTSNLAVKIDNSSTVRTSTSTVLNSSTSSVVNLKSMSLKGPVIKNSADESSKGISSATMAAVPSLLKKIPIGMSFVQCNTTQADIVATSDNLKSVKEHQETQQKQSIYALLSNGRPVVLKYLAANKSAMPTNILQASTFNQNSQPKKSESMQQKVLLKIVKNAPLLLSAVSKNQSQINPISSLNLEDMQPLYSFANKHRPAIISSSKALYVSDNLIPTKTSLASAASTNSVPPKDSESYTKRVATWMPRCSINSTQEVMACKQNRSSNQKAKWNTGIKITKNKTRLQKTDLRHSEAAATLRNRNVKRKSKDDMWEPPTKRTLHRKCKGKNHIEDDVDDESDTSSLEASKDTVRPLRLFPFSSVQLVKCPRRNQPVVVLNHPDVDVPEVVNVMKTIAKFKGHVLKVLLSKRTTDALVDHNSYNSSRMSTEQLSSKRHRKQKPLSPVKERFVLKLTLKKTSKNNYQIVKNISCNTLKAKFSCWFCGRAFDNQDDWVGHGQRHLMEATRDWHILV